MKPELRFLEFEENWSYKKLKDLLKVHSGRDYKHLEPGEIPVYGTGGYMLSVSDYLSNDDAIGIGRKGTINKPYLLKAPFWTVDTLFYCTPREEVDLYFLLSLFKKINWEKYDESTGVPSLSKVNIEKLKVYSCELEEQRKIGDFFSKLDRQIELEEKKLELLEQQKRGYMQKIFSQELRFKDKNGNEYPEWEVIKLKDILSERKEYASKIGNYPHATLSTSGISLKSDRYNRDFLVKDKNKKYKVTIMNDICYNPANLKFGVITRNHIGSVIFSPIYITFEVNNAHSPLFIELLVTRNDFINRVRKYEEGTVYERMAVKPEDFLNYETKIPCLEEQEKIGNFFSKLDELINKQNQKIDGLKKRKRGFLQKMFV